MVYHRKRMFAILQKKSEKNDFKSANYIEVATDCETIKAYFLR